MARLVNYGKYAIDLTPAQLATLGRLDFPGCSFTRRRTRGLARAEWLAVVDMALGRVARGVGGAEFIQLAAAIRTQIPEERTRSWECTPCSSPTSG